MTSAVEHLRIPVGELTFDARAGGPAGGRLVILLHGFPESSRCWVAQLGALAGAGYRAVAFDQRGYSPGARPDGVESYRVALLVADVLAVADWLVAEQAGKAGRSGQTDRSGPDDRFDLVGHDWGGALAWQVAGRHGRRLRSLTVVSTPHPLAFASALSDREGDQAKKSWYMAWFRTPEEPERTLLADHAAGLRDIYAGLPDDAVAEYVERLSQPGALTAAINWYRATRRDLVEGMGPVTVPTLYLWSDQDVALGRAAAEATGAHVDGPYRFEVLEGVSHWIPEEAADACNRLLLDHLARTA
ncbi:MAG TPA: alpha/beta hydrolase [Acidimicrobiales bacterium]|nr:alpha/beta hydrolase [Acidimicrobiales bacterium]